jgi:hypothetical protein
MKSVRDCATVGFPVPSFNVFAGLFLSLSLHYPELPLFSSVFFSSNRCATCESEVLSERQPNIFAFGGRATQTSLFNRKDGTSTPKISRVVLLGGFKKGLSSFVGMVSICRFTSPLVSQLLQSISIFCCWD